MKKIKWLKLSQWNLGCHLYVCLYKYTCTHHTQTPTWFLNCICFCNSCFLDFCVLMEKSIKPNWLVLTQIHFFSLRQLQVDALLHLAHQLFLTVFSLCLSFQLTHQPLSFYRSNLTYYFPKNIKTIQPGLSCHSFCFLQLSLYFHPCFSFLPMLEG